MRGGRVSSKRTYESSPVLNGIEIQDQAAIKLINRLRTLVAPTVVNQTDLYLKALELQGSEDSVKRSQGDALVAYLLTNDANLDEAVIAVAQA